MIKLTSDSPEFGLTVADGDRIAQAMIIPAPQISFVEVEELSDTIRGEGGFGSSGK